MTYNLSQPLGNNVFSYDQRKALGSDCSLVISDIMEISSLDQVQLGDFVVFEEVDHLGRLHSHTGLAHTYILQTPQYNGRVTDTPLRKLPKIIITDNHNHVLPHWLQFISEYKGRAESHGDLLRGFTSLQSNSPQSSDQIIGNLPTKSSEISLIHIDQHSDLGLNSNQLDLSQLFAPSLQERGSGGGYLRNFAHLDCNIGNFITPCIDSGLISHMTQVRTEFTLAEIASLQPSAFSLQPLIVDIDLDFRAPEMGITNIEHTMSQVRSLMDHADLITIATSPYFIDQKLALELLHQLMGPRLAKHDINDTV